MRLERAEGLQHDFTGGVELLLIPTLYLFDGRDQAAVPRHHVFVKHAVHLFGITAMIFRRRAVFNDVSCSESICFMASSSSCSSGCRCGG